MWGSNIRIYGIDGGKTAYDNDDNHSGVGTRGAQGAGVPPVTPSAPPALMLPRQSRDVI